MLIHFKWDVCSVLPEIIVNSNRFWKLKTKKKYNKTSEFNSFHINKNEEATNGNSEQLTAHALHFLT